ncbi:MAG: glycosyltransferase [Candidatus Paralactobacillus gallistercoris]|uniref:Glycosyltransferase n=1 Tax=Candidatus Paralactobacillus gallistercoris TaxID=2838724 RepID=A0A948TJJ4_9LACO|nr:glycosyltransferase [Candidatus Paralactobacillus gallistercoris]
MRLLEINSVVNFGSTGKIVSDLALYAQHHGAEVLVCYGRGQAQAPFALYRIGRGKLNFYEAALETRLFDNAGFASRYPTKKLIKVIDQFQPDVIHLHNLHGYYINVAELFTYLAHHSKAQVVWTLHDIWPFSPHAAIMALDQNKVPTTILHHSELSLYPQTWFWNRKDHNYWRKQQVFTQLPPERLHFVAPSKWMATLVHNSFFKNYPVAVIYNGIDVQQFINYLQKPLYQSHNGKKRGLAVASVWNNNKGLSYLNQIAHLLADDLQLTLVGDLRGQHVDEHINAVGAVPDIAQLTQFYQQADVFINPTLAETFGLTNVEALVCGTPVITFAAGGNAEMLTNQTGTVVPRGNLPALLTAIKQSTKNDVIAQLCQQQGIKFNKNKMNESYWHLYQQLLKGN